MKLSDLKEGKSAKILQIDGKGALRHHLLDMGLTPRTVVTLRKVAPMGDPIEIELRGYELTLRLAEADQIEVEPAKAAAHTDTQDRQRHRVAAEHPGMGELGNADDWKQHKLGDAIPKDQPIRFALAGNQNCGKTTLFNQLTGANQHVGNFPGVTVDRKDGTIRNHPEATVTDLPGRRRQRRRDRSGTPLYPCVCASVGAVRQRGWTAGAVCHGAAKLPPAGGAQRRTADLGKSKGFYSEGVYDYLPGDDHHLVFTDI